MGMHMVDSTTVNGNSDSQRPQRNWNALFRGDYELGQYNACVGDNGFPDLYYYADGFADSVFLLIDALTTGHKAVLDTLIYPICFNLRHSVELTIKGQIEDLSQLAKLRKKPLAPDKMLNQHDIMNLWAFFSGHAAAFDQRYKEKVSALEPLIRCIGETDPTGQTFRYSYSTEARKHLTDVSIINVLVLRDQFRILRAKLEELRDFSDFLRHEYSTGTFTRSLSRKDLYAIAGRLPPRQLWADPRAGLADIKQAIRAEYHIGSRELTEAFRKIQDTRGLARIIGLPETVPGLTMADLLTLSDCWKLAWDRDALEDELRNDIAGVTDSPGVPMHLLEVTTHEIAMMRDTRSSFARFMQWATAERVAGLQALMDTRDFRFSEEHDRRYEYYKEELTAAFSGTAQALEAELSENWSRSIGRSNYPSRVIDSLNIAGFTPESAGLEENLFS